MKTRGQVLALCVFQSHVWRTSAFVHVPKTPNNAFKDLQTTDVLPRSTALSFGTPAYEDDNPAYEDFGQSVRRLRRSTLYKKTIFLSLFLRGLISSNSKPRHRIILIRASPISNVGGAVQPVALARYRLFPMTSQVTHQAIDSTRCQQILMTILAAT